MKLQERLERDLAMCYPQFLRDGSGFSASMSTGDGDIRGKTSELRDSGLPPSPENNAKSSNADTPQ
jgi:hypothetical protein